MTRRAEEETQDIQSEFREFGNINIDILINIQTIKDFDGSDSSDMADYSEDLNYIEAMASHKRKEMECKIACCMCNLDIVKSIILSKAATLETRSLPNSRSSLPLHGFMR